MNLLMSVCIIVIYFGIIIWKLAGNIAVPGNLVVIVSLISLWVDLSLSLELNFVLMFSHSLMLAVFLSGR